MGTHSCLFHLQGGRDEGNYLDDALVKQDAQVSRLQIPSYSFFSKTGLTLLWLAGFFQGYLELGVAQGTISILLNSRSPSHPGAT